MPYLEDFLDCLKCQTWRPLQVILVDDGSIDGSAQCLKDNMQELQESGISIKIIFGGHQGQAAAFNAALPFVEGEYFTWCDSDDLLTADAIEKKTSASNVG